jgi:hypothetical protein
MANGQQRTKSQLPGPRTDHHWSLAVILHAGPEVLRRPGFPRYDPLPSRNASARTTLTSRQRSRKRRARRRPPTPGHTPVATPPPPLSVFRERVEGVGVRVIQNVERSPTSHLLSRERFAKRALSQNRSREKVLLWRQARSQEQGTWLALRRRGAEKAKISIPFSAARRLSAR